MSTQQTVSGSCLCGAVQYEVKGELRPIMYCHCEQCRKTSGHYVAASSCAAKELTLTTDSGLRWYRSSRKAERGFCKNCGSSLFWRPENSESISIMAGSLTSPTGLQASSHIYVHMAADYYEINDGLPQYNEDYPSSHAANPA